jgi:hypothetical protein
MIKLINILNEAFINYNPPPDFQGWSVASGEYDYFEFDNGVDTIYCRSLGDRGYFIESTDDKEKIQQIADYFHKSTKTKTKYTHTFISVELTDDEFNELLSIVRRQKSKLKEAFVSYNKKPDLSDWFLNTSEGDPLIFHTYDAELYAYRDPENAAYELEGFNHGGWEMLKQIADYYGTPVETKGSKVWPYYKTSIPVDNFMELVGDRPLDEAFIKPPSNEDDDFDLYPTYIQLEVTVHGISSATIEFGYEDESIGDDGLLTYEVDLKLETSKYYPATYGSPAEGGLEDVYITSGVNTQTGKPLSKNTINSLNSDQKLMDYITDGVADNYDEDYYDDY